MVGVIALVIDKTLNELIEWRCRYVSFKNQFIKLFNVLELNLFQLKTCIRRAYLFIAGMIHYFV